MSDAGLGGYKVPERTVTAIRQLKGAAQVLQWLGAIRRPVGARRAVPTWSAWTTPLRGLYLLSKGLQLAKADPTQPDDGAC